MTHHITLRSLLALVSVLSVACGTDPTGGTPGAAAGTLGGACLPGGSCNPGLACQQSACVSASGSGGGGGAPTGGAGGTVAGGTGGTLIAGAGGVVTATGGAGGRPANGGAGATGTGGDTGGAQASGGTSGSGGTGGCAADTSTDPNNCGTCGHACRGNCIGGKCAPAFAGCFLQSSANSCDAYCRGIQQQCVTGGCDTDTWLGFAVETDCTARSPIRQYDSNGCTVPLPLPASNTVAFRCCCGDP